MSALAIIWRNPKCVRRFRRWTHVKRQANRSVYYVLESGAEDGPGSWEGLPTLEIVWDPATARPSQTAAKSAISLSGA